MDISKGFIQDDQHFAFWGWMTLAYHFHQKKDNKLLAESMKKVFEHCTPPILKQFPGEEENVINHMMRRSREKAKAFIEKHAKILNRKAQTLTEDTLAEIFIQYEFLQMNRKDWIVQENTSAATLFGILTRLSNDELADSSIAEQKEIWTGDPQSDYKGATLWVYGILNSLMTNEKKYHIYLVTAMISVELGLMRYEGQTNEQLSKRIQSLVDRNSIS